MVNVGETFINHSVGGWVVRIELWMQIIIFTILIGR